MDMAELNRIAQQGWAGEFRLYEPMRKHTSWRTGGPAQRAYFPRDLGDLVRFVRAMPKDESVYVVGLGSNLLGPGRRVAGHGGVHPRRVGADPGRAQTLLARSLFTPKPESRARRWRALPRTMTWSGLSSWPGSPGRWAVRWR